MKTEASEMKELLTLREHKNINIEKPIQELFDECLNFISLAAFED